MPYFRRFGLSLLTLLTLIILNSQGATAQTTTGTVRGFVYDKEGGEPIIFTNVYFQQTSIGAATDVNGFFVISRIPPGSYTLMVTSMGFDTLRMPLSIKVGDVITRNLFLEKSAVQLEGVQITAEREEARTETRTSVIKITPRQIKQLPTFGGQADLAQYLQVLPGIIFTGDQGGQLYIRGGPPIQNKVLLDGMIVYNPFHSIGLFSVFDTDLLRNVDVYTGGFNAEFGGRISSVMNLTTRDGNRNRYAGKVDFSTLGAKFLIEGPIIKFREDRSDDFTSSFVLSVKNSYLKESSKLFYSYIDNNGLPYNFLDIYGKISVNSGNGSKVNFYGFNFNDNVNYRLVSDFEWNTYGGGMNFLVIPGKSPALLEGEVAFSSYVVSMNDGNGTPRTSEINGFNVGLGFVYFLGKNQVKYGIETLGFLTDLNFYNSVGSYIRQKQNTTELAAYVKYKHTAGKFLIEPGLRMQWYASLSSISPEPRLAMKYNANDMLRFKLATGMYSQNLLSATSDRDVVNLFYGFLSGSDNLPREFDGKKVTHKLQKAWHLILGLEYDITNNLLLNLEGYVKDFTQLTNLNRDKIYEDRPDYADKPDRLRKDFIIETGMANGVDLSMKYESKGWYLWTVYSLTFVDRYDGVINYAPHFDRRHSVNLVATYQFGEDNNWEVSGRWNYGSGFPFTQSQGYYERLTFNDGIFTDYTSLNGRLEVVYAELNQGRLSDYHRMDISVQNRISFGKHTKLETTASVTNLYNRSNVFYLDRITGERINQLPIMPSLGISLSF
ncbi:MAG: TonB-dependent receptor [Bacteroidales bacterium]|nr:TonB-dependent receptor [Bacteroidales bacterium]